ncbi:MAG: hypothetical protein H7240_00780 [Glaciimonas sp.]|nr:hypothetical protein [Glaciimonas sp.]
MCAILKGAQTTIAHESCVTVIIQELLSGESASLSDMASVASSTFNIFFEGEVHGRISQAPGRTLSKSLSVQQLA